MRVGNLLAWGLLIALALGTVLLVNRVGPFGLVLVGLCTVLVCSLATLNEDVPTWGSHVFRARMDAGGSPEERAARHAERAATVGSLRFYRRCGVALVATGVAALAWQYRT